MQECPHDAIFNSRVNTRTSCMVKPTSCAFLVGFHFGDCFDFMMFLRGDVTLSFYTERAGAFVRCICNIVV